MFCYEEKLVTVRQKANSSKISTQISISLKKYVIDRFIYLHCLKYVLMKATYRSQNAKEFILWDACGIPTVKIRFGCT